MEPTSNDTSSEISSNVEVLHEQTVKETKVSEKCDYLLDQCSCSLSSFSFCDFEDKNATLKLKSPEIINSGDESGAKGTAGGTTHNSSITPSQDVADYRSFCARASSANKLAENSIKHLRTLVPNVKDPGILSFWKNYQKSIDQLVEHFSAPVISRFLSNLAISESNAAIYLDGFEAGLAWRKNDQVKDSTKPAQDKARGKKETASETVKKTIQVDPQVVKELKANGKYKSEWGEVEVQDNKVASLKFNSADLLPGKLLLRMPISVACHFLNRDLELLDKYGEKYPNWCNDIKNKNKKSWEHVRQVLADCSIKEYQWTLHNVFTQIGTTELDDSKLDGTLALSGTVNVELKRIKEIDLKVEENLEYISNVIVQLVYLKCPHAKLALKYIYAAIYRTLLASWHLLSKAEKKQDKISVKCHLYHYTSDLCFDKSIGFLPIRFNHYWKLFDNDVQCDVDINLAGGSAEATRRYLNDKWTKIPNPKPTHVRTIESLRDSIDKGVIGSHTLYLALIS